MSQVICIAGKNNIAVRALHLIRSKAPGARILVSPNASDPGVNGWQQSLKCHAVKLGIECISLEKIYQIHNLLFISLEFNQLVHPEKFNSHRLYNIHFSLLPSYKGMYTSAHPILNGETHSGVSLHFIDAGIDTGDLIAQRRFSIGFHENAKDLYTKYLENAYFLLEANLEKLLFGQPIGTRQPSENSTYFSKHSINYSSLSVNYKRTAFEIHNQVRAFTFREYQSIFYGDFPILRSRISDRRSSSTAGTLVWEDHRSFVLATIDYDIFLDKDYYPALWSAASKGHCDEIASILPFIENIDERSPQGWSAAILAAYAGHLPALELILSAGADINGTNWKGTNLLMYALNFYERTGDSSILKFLQRNGADLRLQDEMGMCVTDYAVLSKSEVVISKE